MAESLNPHQVDAALFAFNTLKDSFFRLTANPFPEQASQIPLGTYELPQWSGEAHL